MHPGPSKAQRGASSRAAIQDSNSADLKRRGSPRFARDLKAAEAIVAILLPPACREEVLGDLHQRYRSPLQYGLEALQTVPLVIISRIRRTADPQLLLLQILALFVSFFGTAWLAGGALLRAPWGPLRLAIPVAVALVGLILEDAYAKPGWRAPRKLTRGPVIGLGLALLWQGMLWALHSDFVLPRWIMLYGCAMGLLLSSAVRILFPPGHQLQGVNIPASWLKQAGDCVEFPKGWLVTLLIVLLVLSIAYQAWK